MDVPVGERARPRDEPRRPESGYGTVGEITHGIFELERRLGLLEQRIGGVFWWPLLRVETFYELARRLGVLDEARPDMKRRRARRRGRALGRLDGSLYSRLDGWRNRTRARQPTPARFLVLLHERKLDRGRGPVDIYTERLLRELPAEETLLIDQPRHGRYALPGGDRVVRIDRLKAHSKRARRALSWEPDASERKQLTSCEEAFLECFGTRVPLAERARAHARKFIVEEPIYGQLLDERGIEQAFLTAAFAKQALVAAAQARGIRVHELQCDAITPFHTGYAFPDRPRVPHSPDTVLCYGPFWAAATPWAAEVRPLVVGRAAILDDVLERAHEKRPRQAIFVSQATHERELASAAARTAALAPDWRFILRPHPEQNDDEVQRAIEDTGGTPPPNLAISTRDESFYERLAESDVQVGVNSMGLYEGMWLGCRTVLLDRPGVETFGPVLERRNAVLARTPEEIVAGLASAPAAQADDYFSAPVASIRDVVGC